MMKSFTKEEKSWILYDVGNSAFVLVIVTAMMPIFFKEFCAAGLDNTTATAYWGYANSFSSLLLAIAAPVFGALADRNGMKMRFFISFLAMGVIFNLALPLCTAGAWLLGLIIFTMARTGWAGSLVFYDAFIVDITDEKRMHRVSSAGYAWGYIGSVIPFLIIMALIFLFANGKDSIAEMPAKAGFVIVAIWWLIFSMPMIRDVRQKYYVKTDDSSISGTFKRMAGTFRELKKYRLAFTFLIAYFFYIDGVDTIIAMSVAYGVDMGLGAVSLMLAILMIQVVAFPFSIIFGKCADRFSVKLMLYVGIAVYCLITLLAFFLPQLPTIGYKTALFWFMSFLVATSMGGVQALSRSYFGSLIPPERSGEFFGFYNIMGKFATIIGPLLMGAVGQAAGDTRWGVLSIFLLFMTGGVILAGVKDNKRYKNG